MTKRDNSSKIGDRIMDIRKKLRLQQKEMAAALNIAASYLCDIEKGKANPGPDFLIKVALTYDVNLNYLLLGTGDMFGNGGKVKTNVFEIENGIEVVEELNWLMEKSIFFKNAILSQANKILIVDKELIKKSIRMKKAKTAPYSPSKEKRKKPQ